MYSSALPAKIEVLAASHDERCERKRNIGGRPAEHGDHGLHEDTPRVAEAGTETSDQTDGKGHPSLRVV